MATPNFRHDVWEDFRAISVRRHNCFFFAACLITRSGFLAVFLYRLASLCVRSGKSLPLRVATSFFWRLNILLSSCDISPRAVIGAGLKIPHPVGVTVGHARVGKNVMLMQNSTLGLRWFNIDENDPINYPVLGDKVIICAGAQVLGPVTVNDGAIVGANSVVTHDVPAGHVAVGVPAHIRRAEHTH